MSYGFKVGAVVRIPYLARHGWYENNRVAGNRTTFRDTEHAS
jgi:hypothetical protein